MAGSGGDDGTAAAVNRSQRWQWLLAAAAGGGRWRRQQAAAGSSGGWQELAAVAAGGGRRWWRQLGFRRSRLGFRQIRQIRRRFQAAAGGSRQQRRLAGASSGGGWRWQTMVAAARVPAKSARVPADPADPAAVSGGRSGGGFRRQIRGSGGGFRRLVRGSGEGFRQQVRRGFPAAVPTRVFGGSGPTMSAAAVRRCRQGWRYQSGSDTMKVDIWGPATTPNISGSKWFVTFIDDCTRVSWIYLLKAKSDVSRIFPIFHVMIQNQFGTKIKHFRSDNARDYFNQILSSYFQKEGIIHESSCVATPQQNGVAERKNRHLLECTRALLFQHNIPKSYWGEAILTSSYIINRLPSKVLGLQSPLECLSKFHPDVRSSFNLTPRIFGCTSFVHIHSHNRGKLDPRALKCIFVGYSSTQKGYKCYHPPTRKMYISADVTFVEDKPYFTIPYLQGELHTLEDMESNFPPSELLKSEPLESQSSKSEPRESQFESHFPPYESSEPQTESSKFESESNPESPLESSKSESRREPQSESNKKSGGLEGVSKPSDSTRFEQVYARKRDPMVTTMQEQSFEPNSGNEVRMNELETSPEHLPVEPLDPNHDLHLPIAMRKKTRECTKKPLYPLSHFVSLEKFSQSHQSFLSTLNTIPIPSSLSEALSKKEWRLAMEAEMNALEKNETWELVDLPKDKKAVGSKWVYTVKFKADGSLERYKARLVAKGYTQTYGVDYQETFAPVAKMNTVRILLSLAVNFDWELQQYDVKNAFLHGELEEEIYMSIPPGFSGAEKNKICLLKKALYGLKQSPRAWFGRFSKVMIAGGYKQSRGDHTLFIKHSASGEVTILIVYVDDIIVTGNDKAEKEALKQRLAKEFEIKDLGKLKYLLGIEVARSKQGIFISQQKYVTDLLKDTGMTTSKPIGTPIEQNHKLSEALGDKPVDKGMYQRLVGRLIYLAHTRPDIAYSAVNYRLLYFLGGNLISWRSKKQGVVSRSSAEAEFRAMATGVCELLWVKIILEDLRIRWNEPMKLYCDNKSAISIAHNPVQHDRTKHIEIDRHFIKEKLDSGLICTPFVPSGLQLADVMTKGLGTNMFHENVSKLGMEDLYSPA
ncbi:hypothetical protein OSB04_019600 [Centaurea solstitialis]|uniref:Integrase catalytic domain-containing protein n=1 Tax=Centaurea solstitialis TaxID=347529 RepID=A0AA38W326_9ASTR|nr:hypothetical protein OSB04_019600 [Centaurea solstitialis]